MWFVHVINAMQYLSTSELFIHICESRMSNMTRHGSPWAQTTSCTTIPRVNQHNHYNHDLLQSCGMGPVGAGRSQWTGHWGSWKQTLIGYVGFHSGEVDDGGPVLRSNSPIGRRHRQTLRRRLHWLADGPGFPKRIHPPSNKQRPQPVHPEDPPTPVQPVPVQVDCPTWTKAPTDTSTLISDQNPWLLMTR